MQNLKRTGYLVLTITLCFMVFAMLQGTLQNHIHFAGIANEIGFTFMLILATIYSGINTITK